jgi:hypothetical protein
MKKIIFAGMLLVAGYSLYAQTVTYQATSSNNTYITPAPIRTNFQTYYPGAEMVVWEPRGEWWHATYKGDNRMTHVYYASTVYYLEHPDNANFKVTLPVLNTYVPDGVITAAINSYGNNLYSITKMKTSNADEVYQVSLMENGTLKNVWMNSEGTAFMDINQIKTDNDKQTLQNQ